LLLLARRLLTAITLTAVVIALLPVFMLLLVVSGRLVPLVLLILVLGRISAIPWFRRRGLYLLLESGFLSSHTLSILLVTTLAIGHLLRIEDGLI
jgi:hypothetical protein